MIRTVKETHIRKHEVGFNILTDSSFPIFYELHSNCMNLHLLHSQDFLIERDHLPISIFYIFHMNHTQTGYALHNMDILIVH